MEIKKGDSFMCIETTHMSDGSIVYVKNNIYYSEIDGCITDLDGDADHRWIVNDSFHSIFRKTLEIDFSKN